MNHSVLKGPGPDINRLVSALRIKIKPRHRQLSTPDGLEGRLNKMRSTVTALIKYERIELHYPRADEARGYAERLISEAIRHGDTHKPTMDAATFWLKEKGLVHKLFKVLVPRYENYQSAYTSLFKAPLAYPRTFRAVSVLELKGNPFPPLLFDGSRNKNFIHNVLLDEARKEFKKAHHAEIIAKVSSSEKQNTSPSSNVKKTGNEALSKAAVDVSEGEQLLKSSVLSNEDENNSEKVESKNDPVLA